jgi:hypothetical protein
MRGPLAGPLGSGTGIHVITGRDPRLAAERETRTADIAASAGTGGVAAARSIPVGLRYIAFA